MSNWFGYPLLLGMGYVGSKIFKQFKIPAAAMLGSMIMIMATIGIGIPWPEIPLWGRNLFQIIIGIMIGARFSRDTLRMLKGWLAPALFVAVWMLMTGLVNGILLSRISTLDFATSLTSATPGGLAEMSILAFSYNLDVSKVAFFHSLRILLVYITIPLTVKWIRTSQPKFLNHIPQGDTGSTVLREVTSTQPSVLSRPVLRSLALGIIGGILGISLGLPAGSMLGALLIIAVLKIIGLQMPPPSTRMIEFAQIGMGLVIGLTFNQPFTSYLSELWLPLLIISLIQLSSGICLAMAISYFFKWDLLTSLCACSPAGVSQMSVIALELDADPIRVSLMHLVRLVTIILFIPVFLALAG
jgi:uncharacterized protein